MKSLIKKVITTVSFLAALTAMSLNAAAAPWGTPEELNAGAAIVIDADTHTVLYGKDMNKQCYPASVTKLLTALIVAEECDPDEVVIVSETALFNMEQGAVVAYVKPGDRLTVRDCLYGLLFRSANDIANVLAEHVSGSIEAFSEVMNKRAEELGCTNSNFVNPSGLSSTEHLTTAYDMALIGAACMDNKLLMDIWTEESYKMSGISERPDGLRVVVGHKMLKESTEYYDERVKGGKTGFTTASGNTLVTLAESNGRRIVSVCLQDKNPEHYLDTSKLLDFGFNYFVNTDITSQIDFKELEKRFINDRIIDEGRNNLIIDGKPLVTLPNGIKATDVVNLKYEYNIPESAPSNAVAEAEAFYQDYSVGKFLILNDRESELVIDNTDTDMDKKESGISVRFVIISILVILSAAAIAYFIYSRNQDIKKQQEAAARRRERLKSMNVSEEEFRQMLEKHREERAKRK